MTYGTTLKTGFVASLLMMVGTLGMAMADQSKTKSPEAVFLICDSADPSLCAAFSEGLSAVAKGQDVVLVKTHDALPETYELAVQFVEELHTKEAIAGHLRWQKANDKPQTGPSLELSVMDAKRPATALREYAVQLLKVTEIQI